MRRTLVAFACALSLAAFAGVAASPSTAHEVKTRPTFGGQVNSVGQLKPGQSVFAQPGQYTGYTAAENRSKSVTTFQWKLNGVPVPGATSQRFYLGADLAGRLVSVMVTNQRAGHTVTSESDTRLIQGDMKTGGLTIEGPLVVGSVLTAKFGSGWGFAYPQPGPSWTAEYDCDWLATEPGNWNDNHSVLDPAWGQPYQNLSSNDCFYAPSGLSPKRTYTLKASDIGKTMALRVTVSDDPPPGIHNQGYQTQRKLTIRLGQVKAAPN